MFEDVFYERLTKLRMARGVSQREMSLSMGQSEGYMTKIESRVSLPSMTVFFYICEYFGITPCEFFDEDNRSPAHLNKLMINLKKLDEKAITHINGIVEEIIQKR